MTFDRNLARTRIIEAALPHVPFDGWTDAVLARAAEEAGYPTATAMRVFPGGTLDALGFWCTMADRAMVETCEADPDFPAMKVREKIAYAIRMRLGPLAPHREAIRRALAAMALPPGIPLSMKTLWATVDAIWRLAGDTATDFNYYSKRGLAAAVYSSTLLYWLEDRSDGQTDSWAFLDRRIADVMALPKAMAGVKAQFAKMPNPFAPLAAKFFRKAS
ncbi:MAG: COQ9 family protein [Alphaproteobacteria bacterium]|nr:COQ9 family protein [Alphaproteobacteria bacterium]